MDPLRNIEGKLMEIGELVLRNGHLNHKERALIALSSAVATFCFHGHGKFRIMARKLGASEEEIEEAESIALRMRVRCRNEYGLFPLGGSQAS